MIYKGINPVCRIHALSCPFLADIPHVPPWKVRHFPSGPPLLLVLSAQGIWRRDPGNYHEKDQHDKWSDRDTWWVQSSGWGRQKRASDSVQLYG